MVTGRGFGRDNQQSTENIRSSRQRERFLSLPRSPGQPQCRIHRYAIVAEYRSSSCKLVLWNCGWAIPQQPVHKDKPDLSSFNREPWALAHWSYLFSGENLQLSSWGSKTSAPDARFLGLPLDGASHLLQFCAGTHGGSRARPAPGPACITTEIWGALFSSEDQRTRETLACHQKPKDAFSSCDDNAFPVCAELMVKSVLNLSKSVLWRKPCDFRRVLLLPGGMLLSVSISVSVAIYLYLSDISVVIWIYL